VSEKGVAQPHTHANTHTLATSRKKNATRGCKKVIIKLKFFWAGPVPP